jgi:hypothetical protein
MRSSVKSRGDTKMLSTMVAQSRSCSKQTPPNTQRFFGGAVVSTVAVGVPLTAFPAQNYVLQDCANSNSNTPCKSWRAMTCAQIGLRLIRSNGKKEAKWMAMPAKNSLLLSARKLLASKSTREVERIVGRRKVKAKRRLGRLLRASKAWQRWEEELLGKEHDLVVARKTGRTLNAVRLHRGSLRIAAVPSPNLWTKKEMALFGTMTDSEIARRTKRDLWAVYAKRRKSGFAPCNPKWKPWTKEDKALLGKMSDADVVRLTGHTAHSVKQVRCKLRIPCLNPKNIPWTAEHDALLGQLPDREVARVTGHTFAAVRTRRIARGLRDPSVRPDWTPEEDRWLGTASDDEVSRRLNRTLSAVNSRRKDFKIPAWRPENPL